jgi:hypothetical protein
MRAQHLHEFEVVSNSRANHVSDLLGSSFWIQKESAAVGAEQSLALSSEPADRTHARVNTTHAGGMHSRKGRSCMRVSECACE